VVKVAGLRSESQDFDVAFPQQEVLLAQKVKASSTTPITLILNWHPERGK